MMSQRKINKSCWPPNWRREINERNGNFWWEQVVKITVDFDREGQKRMKRLLLCDKFVHLDKKVLQYKWLWSISFFLLRESLIKKRISFVIWHKILQDIKFVKKFKYDSVWRKVIILPDFRIRTFRKFFFTTQNFHFPFPGDHFLNMFSHFRRFQRNDNRGDRGRISHVWY